MTTTFQGTMATRRMGAVWVITTAAVTEHILTSSGRSLLEHAAGGGVILSFIDATATVTVLDGVVAAQRSRLATGVLSQDGTREVIHGDGVYGSADPVGSNRWAFIGGATVVEGEVGITLAAGCCVSLTPQGAISSTAACGVKANGPADGGVVQEAGEGSRIEWTPGCSRVSGCSWEKATTTTTPALDDAVTGGDSFGWRTHLDTGLMTHTGENGDVVDTAPDGAQVLGVPEDGKCSDRMFFGAAGLGVITLIPSFAPAPNGIQRPLRKRIVEVAEAIVNSYPISPAWVPAPHAHDEKQGRISRGIGDPSSWCQRRKVVCTGQRARKQGVLSL